MKIRHLTSIISLLLLCAMTFTMVACAAQNGAETNSEAKTNRETVTNSKTETNRETGTKTETNKEQLSVTKKLSEGVPANAVDPSDLSPADSAKVTDFALRLFKAGEKHGENTLISPLSMIYALSMTANGARGETLSQMEAVLGMSKAELNDYLYSYMRALPHGDSYKLTVANSVWFNDSGIFNVNEDFLRTNADYYSADIFKGGFDTQTLRDINAWVNENTDGMIPNILDNIDPLSVMYLVNAIAFDAEWASKYFDYNVQDGTFTKEDGTTEIVEFMSGSQGYYLKDGNALGFMKYYSGNKYAFVALLPDEDVSVSDYTASLDGEKLHSILTNKIKGKILTKIPKFTVDYDAEMSGILKNMGMKNAFDVKKADFTGLGTSGIGNLYISSVIHKTHIEVGELGTKAGAATLVEVNCGTSVPEPDTEPPKEIYLNRPFVYMLIDCENNIPFFIGTVMDVK